MSIPMKDHPPLISHAPARATRVAVLEEDEAYRRDILLPALHDHGFSAHGMASAAELYRHMLSQQFDIVLLDISLPDENGLTVAQHLRETLDIGIVILSDWIHRDHHIQAFKRGADVYLTKPVDVDVLVASLHSLARRLALPMLHSIAANPQPSPSCWRMDAGGWRFVSPDGKVVAEVNNGFVWSSINDGATTPGNPTYGGMAGTSQATPHVSGTVAMIIGATEAAGLATPSPADITNILVKSARPFPVTEDHVIGAGIVDAAAAVKLALNGDPGNPGDGDNDPGITLTKGVILSGQTIGAGAAVRYSITVPAGATTLNIRTIGGSGGDVSLYVKAGRSPAADGSDADFSSVKPGNNEAIVIQKPEATTYYILVVGGVSATSNLSVLADYKP